MDPIDESIIKDKAKQQFEKFKVIIKDYSDIEIIELLYNVGFEEGARTGYTLGIRAEQQAQAVCFNGAERIEL